MNGQRLFFFYPGWLARTIKQPDSAVTWFSREWRAKNNSLYLRYPIDPNSHFYFYVQMFQGYIRIIESGGGQFS